MINIFNKTEVAKIIARINKLTPDTKPLWGKMSVDQMLAHCNVTYELSYENIHPKPSAIMRFILRTVVKKGVVNEVPYKKNLRTAPVFIISDLKNFEVEKKRLIDYLNKTVQLGEAHFDGRASHSFGNLTTTEWNNMFAKHLDHHLGQFGV